MRVCDNDGVPYRPAELQVAFEHIVKSSKDVDILPEQRLVNALTMEARDVWRCNREK